MACTNTYTLGGVAQDCNLSKGGITELYVAKWEYMLDNTSSDTHTLDTSKKPTFYKINVNPNQTQYTTDLATETQNGIPTYTTTLSFNLLRMSAEKRLAVLGYLSNELAIIVKDKNGEYHYIGASMSAEAIDGTVATTGTNKTDINQYSVTVKCEEAFLPIIITSEVFGTLVTE